MVLLLLVFLLIPVVSDGQVNCFQYPGGVLSCDGPSGNTTIQQFSPGAGVITQHGRGNNSLSPYTITPAPAPSRDLNRAIVPLGLLPALGSSSYEPPIPSNSLGYDPYGNGSVK